MSTSKREVLVSVTKKDLRIDTFRCGGKGGQNVNKRDTGVRITHVASGAVGEARDERSQGQNRTIAFRRMADHPKFKAWLKVQTALKMEGIRSVETRVEHAMNPKNLRVEGRSEVTGKWERLP